MIINDKIKLGSKTAKDGFSNEDDVVACFNNWKKDAFAQKWLESMNYNLTKIKSVQATKINGGYKTDVQVHVMLTMDTVIDCQNLQVKLVSNVRGFNQIDKRWVDKYVEAWDIDDATVRILKLFTGELSPYGNNLRDSRRMFIDELTGQDRKTLLAFFTMNKTLVIADILKGRGRLSAEWMLVILKDNKDNNKKIKWVLKPMNYVLNFYDGDVGVTRKGNLKIGKITAQRKGGDRGRSTANMLQFKIDPTLLFK